MPAPTLTPGPEGAAPGGGPPAPAATLPEAPPEEAPSEEVPPEIPAPGERVVERRREDGVWREEALPRLDLDLRPKFDLEPDEAHAEHPGAGAPSEGRQIEERLEAYFRDQRAEEHARSRADPALMELRRRLEGQFTVPMEVLEDAPTNPTLGLGGAARAYLSQAQRYGATGNPYEEDFLAPGAPGALDTVASSLFRYGNADADWEPPISATTATVTTLVARIEVRREEEGVEARIVESSGVPRFDRLALERIREELERRPPPEEARRTRWAFVSSLRVTRPAPARARARRPPTPWEPAPARAAPQNRGSPGIRDACPIQRVRSASSIGSSSWMWK